VLSVAIRFICFSQTAQALRSPVRSGGGVTPPIRAPSLPGTPLCKLGQMLMVNKIDDLADAAHVGEQAQRLLRATSADSNDVHDIPEAGARLFEDVQMVGEHDGLNAVADRRERFEAVACAGFVEACENIVANKGRRLGTLGIIFDIGKP
jgi:hypothetical protein